MEDDSWDVQAGVPVQSRPPLVYSDGLLDSPPGHLVFLVQYLGLFQAALVAHIVQMFTHRCSRVSAYLMNTQQADTLRVSFLSHLRTLGSKYL